MVGILFASVLFLRLSLDNLLPDLEVSYTSISDSSEVLKLICFNLLLRI